VAAERLRLKFADENGEVPAALQPLLDSLARAERARSVLEWLRRNNSGAEILRGMIGRDDISHDASPSSSLYPVQPWLWRRRQLPALRMVEQDVQISGRENAFDAADHLAEEPALDVGHDESDPPGRPDSEPARIWRDNVVELRCGRKDAGSRRRYSMASGFTVTGLYYNKDLLARLGISRPPANVGELEYALKKAKAAGITGIMAGNQSHGRSKIMM
jgi:hypothetical protein